MATEPDMMFKICAIVALTAAATTACTGDDRSAARDAQRKAALGGTGHTSDRLERALLTEAGGYRRGRPDAGEYGSLKAVRNSRQLQRQMELDKPQCSDAASESVSLPDETPAATVGFATDDGHAVSQTLMAVPAAAAEQQIAVDVPAACRSFRIKVGGEWVTTQIVSAERGRIGEGSRTVGVAIRTAGAPVKTWTVVSRGRGYLSTINLHGPGATRKEAERLAQRSHARADRELS